MALVRAFDLLVPTSEMVLGVVVVGGEEGEGIAFVVDRDGRGTMTAFFSVGSAAERHDFCLLI